MNKYIILFTSIFIICLVVIVVLYSPSTCNAVTPTPTAYQSGGAVNTVYTYNLIVTPEYDIPLLAFVVAIFALCVYRVRSHKS